jgi:ectoine hydroxylase-related dioxygenase (phytanoyl-CoA dioxygenase family)
MTHRTWTRPDVAVAAVETFNHDGVVCLRDVFDAPDLSRLADAVESLIKYNMTVRFEPDGPTKGEFVGGRVRGVAGLPDDVVEALDWLSFESPAPRVAAELMGCQRVRLFGDAVFVKEPGSDAPTPWHHDYSYWPFDGDKLCSVWVPLDEATEETGAVKYVQGSHLSDRLFAPAHFRSADDWDVIEGAPFEFESSPRVDERSSDVNLVSFHVAPGDCVVHHARTVHGAKGNSSATMRRRAVVVRYADEHTRYCGPRFAFEDQERYPKRPVGSELDDDGYPVAWSR